MSLTTGRHRFDGAIAGIGSTSGTRIVVGHWQESPLGPFADVMIAEPAGTRVLLAPDEEVAEFVSTTYSFDRVEIGAVRVEVEQGPGGTSWRVVAPGLEATFQVGGRPALGRLLHVVPRRLAVAPAWARVTDPVARRVLRGVRTRGSAGNGRREYYGATDLRLISSLCGTWRQVALGTLAPVSPDPGFGFGSTPPRPAVTSIVTTVDVP